MWKSLFGGKKQAAGPEVGGTKELLTVATNVPVTPDEAFAAFVDRMSDWWPRDYTWSGDDLDVIGIEARANGRCFERAKDGSEKVWGTVLSLSRPDHIVFAWQISPKRAAIDNEAAASRVDVRLSATDAGGTAVLVVHRDFPRHGEGWEGYKDQMAGAKGWPLLIEAFRAHVSAD